MTETSKLSKLSTPLLEIGVALLIIGSIVAVVPHKDNAGAPCGSVLFSGSVHESRVLLCEWAVRGATWWLWLLVVVGGIFFLSGVLLRQR